MFVTFEGIEGCGKSTQARLLAEKLGPAALLTLQPGGTPAGEGIRKLLLDRRTTLAPTTEVLLFFADRAQHVAEVILPALQAGRIVVCDRYNDSTLAYQGYGRGLPLDDLQRVAALATGGLRPDLTFLIDVSVETGLARVGRRGESDRLEAEREAFHLRVRDGYLALAAAEPDRWVRIDGDGDVASVAQAIEEAAALRGLLVPDRAAL